MFFIDTNKQAELGTAAKAGGQGIHPATGKLTTGAAAGYNSIVFLCSAKLCLLKHKPAGICNTTVLWDGPDWNYRKYKEEQIQAHKQQKDAFRCTHKEVHVYSQYPILPHAKHH